MIPIPNKDDMDRLATGIRLKFHEPEELSDEQVKKIVEYYRSIKDLDETFDETITGRSTGVM